MPSSAYLNKPLRTLAEAAAAVAKARADALEHCRPESGNHANARPANNKLANAKLVNARRVMRAKESPAPKRHFHPRRKAS